ncbi:DNA mismatch repair protein MutS, partial [Burkholderia vietnamiensis]|nr:DNA mismatch repair protein MutS [Burkholderia vietnamiensis]
MTFAAAERARPNNRCRRAAVFLCPRARTRLPRYRIMAKNQPHPSDPAKRQIAARPVTPAPAAPPPALDAAALRGQGLAGL